MLNIAHRGYSARYPENTLLAFEKALALGVGWFETDVRMTRDSQLVIMHDATVDRTTNGQGPVSDLTSEHIRALDAGIWRGSDFAGQSVPTLDEVLTRFGQRAGVVVEVKFPRDEDLPALVASLRDSSAWGREAIVVSTFDLPKIPKLRAMAPELPLTALVRLGDRSPDEVLDEVAALGADTVGPRGAEVTAELVDLAHARGMQVRAWGLGEVRGTLMRHLLECSVDGTTTDHPDALQDLLSERGEANEGP